MYVNNAAFCMHHDTEAGEECEYLVACLKQMAKVNLWLLAD